MPGHEVIANNETEIYRQEQDLNIRSQDVNQPVASQSELPRERSGTGSTEITQNNGKP
jgi:hypothetical protein